MKFTFTLNCRLKCLTNLREHHMAKARRAKAQRGDAKTAALAELGTVNRDRSWLIVITRYGKRKLDEPDNLWTSAKHIKDGVADALGMDDKDPRIRWNIRQETPLPYGVRVEMIGGNDGKQ